LRKNSKKFFHRQKETKMNIYVGNLARSLNESELRETFQAFGEVTSASVIKDKYSGESRGFGFVEMPNKGEADEAISMLNGKDLKGRSVKVNEAKPRDDRPRSGGGFGGGRRF
jgi:RNA recognition motif-containing protein